MKTLDEIKSILVDNKSILIFLLISRDQSAWSLLNLLLNLKNYWVSRSIWFPEMDNKPRYFEFVKEELIYV